MIGPDDPMLRSVAAVILDAPSARGQCWSLCARFGRVPGRALILLSDELTSEDRAIVLELGADLCLERDTSARELASRVRAVLRPLMPAAWDDRRGTWTVQGWRFIPRSREIRGPSGRSLRLPAGDVDLLRALLAAGGDFLSEADLSEKLSPEGTTRWRSRVSRLRQRLRSLGDEPCWLRSEYGAGWAVTEAMFRPSRAGAACSPSRRLRVRREVSEASDTAGSAGPAD